MKSHLIITMFFALKIFVSWIYFCNKTVVFLLSGLSPPPPLDLHVFAAVRQPGSLPTGHTVPNIIWISTLKPSLSLLEWIQRDMSGFCSHTVYLAVKPDIYVLYCCFCSICDRIFFMWRFRLLLGQCRNLHFFWVFLGENAPGLVVCLVDFWSSWAESIHKWANRICKGV